MRKVCLLAGEWKHSCPVTLRCHTALHGTPRLGLSCGACLPLAHPRPSIHSPTDPPLAANILLSRHGTAKICDIGMARVLGNKEYLSMLSGMGTFAWR